MLAIFIVLTGFMLILVIFLFYKNVCCKSKNNNNLIDDIQSELIENKIINQKQKMKKNIYKIQILGYKDFKKFII